MNRPLSLEQKKFIEKQSEQGTTSEDISQRLKVSIWTVRKWRQRLKKGSRWLLIEGVLKQER